MAITTRKNGTNEIESSRYVGRVLEIREFSATRNMSDTLDYSDYQTVACKEAFVYLGRRNETGSWVWAGSSYFKEGAEIPVERRFTWVDVSNHFSWRNGTRDEVVVDVDPDNMPVEMAEDLAAFEAHRAVEQARAAEEAEARAAADARVKKRRSMNTPVKGKKMVVFKGRKHPVGTTGIVAHIIERPGYGYRATPRTIALLKSEHEWQVRSAPGIWVDADNLLSVDCCPDDHDDCAADETGELARACMADAISRGFKKPVLRTSTRARARTKKSA